MMIVSIEELENRLAEEKPDNEDRWQGYALVNVLDHASYVEKHIPGSVNIPKGEEEQFEERYDKGKEIFLYCASADCAASSEVADRLSKAGFTNVYCFEGGMKDWLDAGNEVDNGEAPPTEFAIG